MNAAIASRVLATGHVVLQNAEDIQTPDFDISVATVIAAITTFAVAYLLAKAVAIVLSWASEQTVEYRITIKTFVPILKFVIYITAIVVVMGPIFRLTPTQLLAFTGLLGAALGLGLQDLFANVVGGMVIVFERPYTTGDMVAIGGHYGEVTDVGIRSTKLVTKDDSQVSIPNYQFISEPVSNANSGKTELMAVPELHVANDADLSVATTALEEALRSSPYVYVSPDCPVAVRVVDQPGYVTLRGKAYVNDVRHEFRFKSDVTQRTLEAFDRRGIETPDFAVSMHDRS